MKEAEENNKQDTDLCHDYPTKTTLCHAVVYYRVIAPRSLQILAGFHCCVSFSTARDRVGVCGKILSFIKVKLTNIAEATGGLFLYRSLNGFLLKEL